jgi:hypothetical protein
MQLVYYATIPLLAAFGIVGNILNIVILNQKQFKDPVYFFLKVVGAETQVPDVSSAESRRGRPRISHLRYHRQRLLQLSTHR